MDGLSNASTAGSREREAGVTRSRSIVWVAAQEQATEKPIASPVPLPTGEHESFPPVHCCPRSRRPSGCRNVRSYHLPTNAIGLVDYPAISEALNPIQTRGGERWKPTASTASAALTESCCDRARTPGPGRRRS